jgi:cell division inhibitor SulA
MPTMIVSLQYREEKPPICVVFLYPLLQTQREEEKKRVKR